MNRLLLDEVIDSNRRKRNKLFLLFCLSILAIPLNIFPQVEKNIERISLNGFGRYISVDNQSQIVSIFSFDINGDGIIDIAGLDETGENLYVYYGKGFNSFSNPIKYSFGRKYSGILFKDLNIDGRTNLVLYSKLDGVIVIYSFYGKSIARIMNITVDCCFSNIEAINLDVSPEFELVLYGANFKGIGIISLKRNGRFTYKKIEENETYSLLVPFNLNSDNKIDLIAFNPLSRELILLRNIASYHFSKSIYKKFDFSFDRILVGNFDDDLLNDIALVNNQNKRMHLFYGNGIGGFSRQGLIRIPSNFSSTVVFDFNRDLQDDFIVFDHFVKKLILKTLINDEKILSLPIIELNRLYSLALYRTITTKGIVISTSNGIFLIVYSSLNFKSEKYAIVSNPVFLQTFRFSNELYPKILLIDRESNRLNIITRNEFNSPQDIYSIPMSAPHERIKILSATENEMHIVCFKPLRYNFDYFVIKLKEMKYKREIVTVDGLIKDINIEPSLKGKFLLNIIVQSGSDFRAIVYQPFEVNKILLNEKIGTTDFIDFAYDNLNRNLFFLSRGPMNLNLVIKSRRFDPSFKNFEEKDLVEIKEENYLSAKIFLCENPNNLQFLYVNLSGLNSNRLMVVPVREPSANSFIERIQIDESNSCSCIEYYNPYDKSFTFFNSLSKKVEKIQIRGRGKPINLPIWQLPSATTFAIGYSLKEVGEIVYISNYSIINIERIDL